MKIVVITPTSREAEDIINIFLKKISETKTALMKKGITMEHFFLDDGSKIIGLNNLLISHQDRQGLATTLIEGYESVVSKFPLVDAVVRIDVQEHDPIDMISGIERVLLGNAAVFLPVTHSDVTAENTIFLEKEIISFKNSLDPINKEEILRLYNNTFPLGFQILTIDSLKAILPSLKEGFSIFKNKFNMTPTWGLDLLVALLIARSFPGHFDFYFYPKNTKEWKENKSLEKTEEQAKRSSMMVEVAKDLGCKVV